MTDFPPPDPDDAVAADDLIVSRALDHDLSVDEMAAFDADADLRARRDAMATARTWIADVPVDPAATAAAVAFALAAADSTDIRDARDASVSTLTRRRLPVWLGTAAALMVVVAGGVVLSRGSSDDQLADTGAATSNQPRTAAADDPESKSTSDPVESSIDPTMESTDTLDPAATSTGNPAALGMTVITVNLGANDPADEPFPVPAEDEIVQMRSTDEVAWLGQWASRFARSASTCRDGAVVLLSKALFGAQSDTAELVEIVIDTATRTVAAYALDDCAEIASVTLD